MAYQCDGTYRDLLNNSQSKFHNYQTSTNLYITQESTTLHLAKQPSQDDESPPSQATHLQIQQSSNTRNRPLSSQLQIVLITERFKRVQELLINHSQRESQLHQKIYDFKQMPLDWTQLSPDLTNKVNITEDLKHLVSLAQKQCSSEQMKQLLCTKFQQYYLQRHYGGLRCENVNHLNIQQRGEKSLQSIHFIEKNSINQQPIPQQQSYNRQLPSVLSKSLSYFNLREESEQTSGIGGYVSLVNQSKLTHTQDYCQTNQDNLKVYIPKIIEIEIPLIIYKIKQKVITYDESDIEAPYNDIDQIIDKYSKPYEDLYQTSDRQYPPQKIQREIERINLQAFQQIQNNNESEYSYSSQIGSIMVDSNVNNLPKQTELELTYSRLPQEMLMMDSFAQIGSLITICNQPFQQPHRNQKAINPENRPEDEQNCQILSQENYQLNQLVIDLKEKLYESQTKRHQLQDLKLNLERTLRSQIQKNKCLSEKINHLNPTHLHDKIQQLTNLNTSLYSELQQLMLTLRYKNQEIQVVQHELQQLKIIADKTEEQLIKTEQELACVSRHLQERQWQLRQINNSEEEVIKIASQTQTSLKEQIQKLEQQKTEMANKLHYYQSRLQNQGFNLQYEEAKEIQTIIEQRQHIHQIQLNQMRQRYQQTISSYKTQIDDLKEEIKVLSQFKQAKSQITCTTLKEHIINPIHLSELQSLIKQYDRQLLTKDEEIIKLKESMLTNSTQGRGQTMNKAIDFIVKLTTQLQKEKSQRMALTERIIQIDRIVNKQNRIDVSQGSQSSLVQSFASRLEQILKQNISLKQQIKLHQNKHPRQREPNNSCVQTQRLRKINCKLKRYTLQIQKQLISISGMNRCESHSQIIANLIQERDYYMQLLTS